MNKEYFFCTNSKCSYSKQYSYTNKWYKKLGFHKTKAFGKVQRYMCKACGKTFSDQTFTQNYYLKRKTDFEALTKQFISNNSDCFIARNNNMSSESIRIRRDRMSRNGIFLQETLLDNNIIHEELVADGFESYTRSKYYVNNINILVGSTSGFLYYFTESHSKRKGRVTNAQKQRMKYEYQDKSFSGSTLRKQFKTLIEYISVHSDQDPIVLHTDEHKTYPVVLEDVKSNNNIPEIIHKQTSSKKVRNKDNPLAVANNMDREFRKDMPNFRRKTVCHAKNDRNMLSRVAVYMVTHNFFKPRRISDKARQVPEKHYSDLQLDEKKVNFFKSLFFESRFFLSKATISEYFKKVWMRNTETPFGENWYNLPKFALQ